MHIAMVGALPEDRSLPAGGPVVVTSCLIQAMVRLGARVTAIEWGSSRTESYFDEHLQCDVVPVPIYRPALLANAFRTARHVRRAVEDAQPDVVHVQAVAELGRLIRRPRVLTIRGIPHRDEWLLKGPRRYATAPIMAATFHWTVRKYRHLIAISPYTVRTVRLPGSVQVHNIPNPADDRFFQVERQDSGPTVLTVGILSELKNTLGVVRTAAAVRRVVPDVQFRIAGPWRTTSVEYRRHVEACWEREGLQDTVHFLGHLDREALAGEMARASCLLLPSLQENSPVVIAEALAAGLPVASSRICGIPFLVKEGTTGFLFDPRQDEQIVEAVLTLLTDGERREQMSREARKDAGERFRLDAVAQHHLEVYRQAIEDAGS